MDDKKQLREQLKLARSSLSQSKVLKYSELIALRLVQGVSFHPQASILIYEAREQWNEVNTRPLISLLLKKFPSTEITMAGMHRDAPLPEVQFEYVIVPVVGFDEKCNRLGMGAGWYDRFLAMQNKAVTIGLAYELSRVNTAPRESHDIVPNYIVTEHRTYAP